MSSAHDIDALTWQKHQYSHDKRNHFHILSLHKNDRLKHYGLHFAKYAGRMARGTDEKKSASDTAIDSLLVSLSAANTLGVRLELRRSNHRGHELFLKYVDAAGRFCDACEKIDHLEPFIDIAKKSGEELFCLSVELCEQLELDVNSEVQKRRIILKERKFYIED